MFQDLDLFFLFAHQFGDEKLCLGFIPMVVHQLLNSFDVKRTPRSLISFLGSPKERKIYLTKSSIRPFVVKSVEVGIAVVYFENLSTTTKIEFSPFDLGSGPTKSIVITSNGRVGTSNTDIGGDDALLLILFC